MHLPFAGSKRAATCNLSVTTCPSRRYNASRIAPQASSALWTCGCEVLTSHRIALSCYECTIDACYDAALLHSLGSLDAPARELPGAAHARTCDLRLSTPVCMLIDAAAPRHIMLLQGGHMMLLLEQHACTLPIRAAAIGIPAGYLHLLLSCFSNAACLRSLATC